MIDTAGRSTIGGYAGPILADLLLGDREPNRLAQFPLLHLALLVAAYQDLDPPSPPQPARQ